MVGPIKPPADPHGSGPGEVSQEQGEGSHSSMGATKIGGASTEGSHASRANETNAASVQEGGASAEAKSVASSKAQAAGIDEVSVHQAEQLRSGGLNITELLEQLVHREANESWAQALPSEKREALVEFLKQHLEDDPNLAALIKSVAAQVNQR